MKFFQFTPGLSSVWRRIGVFAALAVASAITVHAGNLYVPNFSFESQPTTFADPRIDSWQKTAQPAGFDTNIFGDWNNLSGVFINFPGPDFIGNANGAQLGFLFAYPQAGLFQDFNSTDWTGGPPSHAFNSKFEAGKSYTFTVGLTSSSEKPLSQGSTLLLSVYYRDVSSNMITVASNVVTYDTNVFTNLNQLIDFQVNVPPVKTNDAWAGQNIGVLIESTVQPQLLGGVWDLDKVRLVENIFVPNFSFESQPTSFVDPRIDSWQKTAQPADFDTNIFGDWNNLTGVFTNFPGQDFIDNADGVQVAFIFAYPQAGFFQDFNSIDWSNGPPTHAFNATFKPGKSYTLTAGFTTSNEKPLTEGSTLQFGLYYRDNASNLVFVTTTTVTYDTNVFSDATHLLDFSAIIPEVKATDPWAGKKIGIQFQSTVNPFLLGGVWDVDNVRLTEKVATALNSPGVSSGHFNFTLQSEPGLTFQILASPNINQSASNWVNIGTVTNVTGTTSFTDPSATGNKQFYRARGL